MAAAKPSIPLGDLESFTVHLKSSTRILALLGAGLSASSGLPTFRGAGGLWRNHDAISLATPEAFQEDPTLVWQFYSYRRHMALQAKPNKAHFALAELARRRKDFITLSQNVDGLSQRAGHPTSQLQLIHGSLFDVRCTSFYCKYSSQNDFSDPIVPALAIPRGGFYPKPAPDDKTGEQGAASFYVAMEEAGASTEPVKEPDISDVNVPIPDVSVNDLPHCPKCKEGVLRPGVVWFGEMLPKKALSAIQDFTNKPEKIDLMLVIGTSSKVYPAAGYVDIARAKGARVAVVNMDRADTPGGKNGLAKGDWFFEGDAGEIVPEILKSVVGEL